VLLRTTVRMDPFVVGVLTAAALPYLVRLRLSPRAVSLAASASLLLVVPLLYWCDDDLSYLREYEHVTLARILLARHTAAGAGDDLLAALALLARLLAAAEAGGRTGTAIEILVLQALAHQADGDTPRALAHLERALALAEPEGFVRLFAAEGSPMAVLLNTLAYNPPGSSSEGYLFWLSWLNHVGSTVFSTQDAHGPIRHGLIVLSCSTAQLLRSVASTNQQLGTLVALLNAPSVEQICPKSGQVP